jgi:hypothetical protein
MHDLRVVTKLPLYLVAWKMIWVACVCVGRAESLLSYHVKRSEAASLNHRALALRTGGNNGDGDYDHNEMNLKEL